MNIRKILIIFLTIFIPCSVNLFADIGNSSAAQNEPDRILVLNSYHYGFTWTDLEMRGIQSVMRKSAVPVVVQVEYLDAKRFTSPAVNRRFRELLGAKTAGMPVRVIITTDNIALETALSVRPSYFPDASIVFCGFNGNPDPVIAGKRNVTGIMEKWNPRGTLDAIASLQPGVRRLVVIHDRTESGLGTRDDFIDVIGGYERKYEVRYLTGMKVENMFDVISRLEGDTAVILLGFNMDSSGRVFDSASTGGLFASRSSVPVYTVDETRFNGGVVGGRLLTGERQGEIAARMAIRILSGQRADEIPIVRNDPGVFIFAYDAMKKYGLSSDMLPAGSAVRNRPESIYDRYRTQVWAVSVVFAALVGFIIILAYNVFRRKKVEEDRKRLVSAIEEADDIFCFSSADENVLYMNAAGMSTLGWKQEEIDKGLKSLKRIHPEQVTEKLHDVIYESLMKNGKWKGESAVLSGDGREIPVSQVITMHTDENGKPQYFSSIIRDISEQKRNEEVLRSSEENLRITLDSIGDAVIATDETGVVRRINPAAEKITGWSCSDAVGKKLSDVFCIVSASEDSEVENPVDAVLRSGSTVFMQDRKTVLISSDGTRRMIADSAAPIRDTENRVVGVVLVFHDMTEEYSMQDQLRRAQRMEVIGQLAGGVAHDFNNILAVILGTAQILEDELPQKSDERALAEDIVGAAIRASELTRQLLAFSRKGKMQMVEIHLHDVVREVGRLLERSIDKSIRIVENLEAPSDVIMGDPSLIQSAILNLAVNARDAMPKGGELSFESGIVRLAEDDCAAQGAEIEPGEYISLSVTDNGEGMSEETRNRLFEPYFTTKPEGKGTGLGLAAVYGCVRSHHGCIQVQSELGKGSVFRLLFPLSSSETGNRSVEFEGAVHGSGTILVVDDEDIVRNMTVKALNALGYRAVDASDGYAAMDRLKERGGDVGLVILDIVMPVIGGRETFHMMKKEYPDLKILLCSGFTRHGVTDELLKAGAAGFIAKPFRIDEISRKIAALMPKNLTV